MRRKPGGRPVSILRTWLAIWMARRRVTAKRLATATGMSVNAIAGYRLGTHRPLDDKKVRLADATLAIEKEQGIAARRGVTTSDWYREPPTEADARRLVPWAFPEPAPAPVEESADEEI